MSDCKSESCWITLHEIIRHLTPEELNRFKNSFRPHMPRSWLKNKNEWASTTDIEKVLKQYEDIIKILNVMVHYLWILI